MRTALRTIILAIREWLPSELFRHSEVGVWYDPSDFTTMFQDSAGTTPVTSVEQPVGLLLDKSKGLVLGAELSPVLIPANWFDNIGSTWAFSGGIATHSGAASNISTNIITVGKFYKITYKITSITTGSIKVYIGLGNNVDTKSTSGTYTAYGVAVTNGIVYIDATLNCDASVSNISVRELPGNHATQATSTKRPVLSARYNLLTKTEDFGDAVWTKTNATISANAITAPDGTLTADKLVESITAGGHSVAPTAITTTTGNVLLVSFQLKAGERNYAAIYEGVSGKGKFFDLLNGTVLGDLVASPLSASITALGGGFYKCTITVTAGASAVPTVFCSTDGSTFSYAGDITKGIYIWGASLVPADQASLPYQRVDTATSYALTPFKQYEKFDAVDDVLDTTFGSSLGATCTVARAVPGVGASILTGQTIGTSYAASANSAALVIVNRALTAPETASLTAYLNAKAGV